MKDDVLKDALKKLEAMRDGFDPADTESRGRLTEMIEHINAGLKEPGGRTENRRLIDRLKEKIVHFEAKHPRITEVVNEIEIKLMSLGI